MGANVNQTKPSRLYRWFSKKQHKDKREHSLEDFFSVEDQYGFDDSMDEFSARSLESNPCIMTANLRIFLGTWNVGGRFPVGSMDVDLEEWLNLKDEADIYVIGFQEIVPLKARTVMGVERHNLATSWNLLIGQALNQKHGYPWFTPRFDPNFDEEHKVSVLNCVGRSNFSDLDVIPGRGRCRKWHQTAQGNDKYMLIASKKMVGVFISVWMKKELLRKYRVSNVKLCSVPCGIMGYLGNKGSVSVSLSIEGTSFCFVVAHLASGEKKGDINRRNHQVSEIIRQTLFPRNPKEVDDAHPVSILGHDKIFWFGDLNYRLCLEDGEARQLIRKQDWKALQAFDQLGREQEEDGVFEGWHEGNIEFAPTYKYSASNCNIYSGSFPSIAWEKQRTPAWCDRILWYGKGIKQLSYLRGESKFSDHRPVYALFSTEIEVRSHSSEVIPFHALHPTIVSPRLVRRELRK